MWFFLKNGDKIKRAIVYIYKEKEMKKNVNKETTIDKVRDPAEGITQNASKKTIEIAHRMLQEDIDMKFISSVTGLSRNELIKIKATNP